jgi:hypothetical protein
MSASVLFIGCFLAHPRPANGALIFNSGFEDGTTLGWSIYEGNVATISTDFREYPPDLTPADWSPIIHADVEAIVSHSSSRTAGTYLEIWQQTPDAGELSGYKWDVLDNAGDVEMIVKVLLDPSGFSSQVLAAVRASGTPDAEAMVRVQVSESLGAVEFQVRSLVGGLVRFSSDPVFKNFAVGAPLLFRWKVSGTSGNIRTSFRAWALGTPEPTAWDLDDVSVTGTQPPDTGAVALISSTQRGRVRFLGIGVELL